MSNRTRILPKRVKAIVEKFDGCRFNYVAFCQQPPTKRTILFSAVTGDAGILKIQKFLDFPYVNFFIHYYPVYENLQTLYTFRKVYVGFSETANVISSSVLQLLPLKNYLFDMQVCLGNLEKNTFESPDELIEYVISLYWQTAFDMIFDQDDQDEQQQFENFTKWINGAKANECFVESEISVSRFL